MYHAGKAGFAAYVAHVTETVPESEMRMVSLYVNSTHAGLVACQGMLQLYAHRPA